MLSLVLLLTLLVLLFLYHFMNWQPLDTSVLYKNRDFLLIGHRGSPKKSPENTIPSFIQAIDDGCNAIELDVYTTRDGHLIVFHDDDLGRTTNGTGAVADQTLAQLQSLNAASLWPDRHEQIPTLQAVVDALPSDILINIEVKNYSLFPKQKTEQQVVRFIHENDLNDRVIVSSFHPLNIWKIKHYDPTLFTAFLWFESSWFSWRHCLGIHFAHPDILHPAEDDISNMAKFWSRIKKLPLHVWVVDEAEQMGLLAREPMIKGIMSDDSELMVKTLGKRML